jgi:hypothetical protein
MIDYQSNFDNINFDLDPLNYKVLGINFSNGHSQKEIVEELKKEKWNPYGVETKIDHDLWKGYRYKVHRPASPMLQQIVRYFLSSEAKRKVIDALYAQKTEFKSMWGMTADMMMDNSLLHAEFTKDLPGFENGIHCDYRLLIGTGLVYFTDQDSGDHCTVFYDDPQRNNPFRVPSDFGQGWFHANDWNTWHDGWNRTTEDRYSMLLGLTVLLKNR